MKYWSRGVLEQLEACPCCGTQKEPANTWRRMDDNRKMPDLWTLCRCGNCGSIYLNPRPDKNSLPKAYDKYHTHAARMDERALVDKGLIYALVRDYLRWRFNMTFNESTQYGGRYIFWALFPLRQKLDRFGRHLHHANNLSPEKRGVLLDIGCGNGSFLRLAKSMGWEAKGQEIDPKAIAFCRKNGMNVITDEIGQLGAEYDEAYDVITMNHVIEHVVDPQGMLAKCLQLLRPEGMLWMAFPNPDSFGLKLFRDSWCALHPPFHLQLPTHKQLKYWLLNSGFERIKFFRRGMHAKAHWHDSLPIAQHEDFRLPATMLQHLFRLGADLLSTLTPRWAEETVVIAYRPSLCQEH